MRSASTSAGLQRLLPARFSASMAAKDAAVCPEGNEASVGGAISSDTAGLTAKGRIRPIMGLSQMLHSSKSSISAQATQAPARLVFGNASSIAASRIQISPWSHRCVTHGSIVSKSPQRRCACIQFKIASSAACTCAHLLASQQWSYHIIFAVK